MIKQICIYMTYSSFKFRTPYVYFHNVPIDGYSFMTLIDQDTYIFDAYGSSAQLNLDPYLHYIDNSIRSALGDNNE